jgi:mono/diheme cytochrome c family protein
VTISSSGVPARPSHHLDRRWTLRGLSIAMGGISLLCAGPAAATSDAQLANQARDLLASRCGSCHGANDPAHGVSVLSREAMVTRGVLVPGDLDSELLEEVQPEHGEPPEMPAGGAAPLSDAEVAILVAWVQAGAPAWEVDATEPAFTPLEPAASPSNEGDRGDLVILDGGFAQIALYGFVATQAAMYTGADNLLQDGDVAEQPGFRLRHGRFGLHGWAFSYLDFMISMETADAHVKPLDAWVAYRPLSFLGAVLGAQKVPFSRFAMTSSSRGSLIERPLSVDALAPYRQMGMTFEGTIGAGLASYALGVYNGLDRHTNFHEGYVENPVFQGNRFNKVSVAGRLSLEPLGAVGPDMADLDEGGLRLGVGMSVLHNEGATTRTTAWTADVVVKVAGLHFIAEYLADTSEPTIRPTTPQTIPAQADRFGVIGEVGYMLLPSQLGVTARVEWFDDDEAVDNSGDQLVATGGLQYYWHRHHFKAALNYIHREELFGPSLDNDTLLLSAHFSL